MIQKYFEIIVFQSTPSAWRETPISFAFLDALPISIHSLRMEGDYLPNNLLD